MSSSNNNQRSLRVAQSIKRELADMIRKDIKDDRVGGIVSITEVECTQDLRAAKVYVSIFGDQETREKTMAALQDEVGRIRGELCRRLGLRFAPELSIRLDDSLERGSRVTDLLGKISRGEV
ncbi:MAG TPA: 30S ribosome-binding factor RbfA [Planktothrix sp.]|jgi:ribosome-binding factor A